MPVPFYLLIIFVYFSAVKIELSSHYYIADSKLIVLNISYKTFSFTQWATDRRL